MAILKNFLFTKCIKNFFTSQFKSLGYLSKHILYFKRYLLFTFKWIKKEQYALPMYFFAMSVLHILEEEVGKERRIQLLLSSVWF